jgi:hypothetical protein
MKTSITLNEAQQKTRNDLIRLIAEIEKEMAVNIDSDNGEMIAQQLANLVPYLANTSKIMESATAIYDWAKGQVADEAFLNPQVLNAKQQFQRAWMEGKLSEWNALYERSVEVCKSLDKAVMGLQTLLSFQKNLHRQSTFTGGSQR